MKFFTNLSDKGCEGTIYIPVEIVLGLIYIALRLLRASHAIRFKHEYNNFMTDVHKL